MESAAEYLPDAQWQRALRPAPGHAVGTALPYGGLRDDWRHPNEILYDRMKTAVIREAGGGVDRRIHSRVLIFTLPRLPSWLLKFECNYRIGVILIPCP